MARPFNTSLQSKARQVQSSDLTGKNLEILCEEDFSKFTAGTEEQHDATQYGENYQSGEPYLPDELFHSPGWSGEGVYQAGGACALAYANEDGGFGGTLNSPEGYYNGKVYVTFRARALNGSAPLAVSANKDGVYFPSDNSSTSSYEMVYLKSDWQEVCLEFIIPYAQPQSFIQFNGWFYSDGLLIDDIKIYRDKDFVYTPNMTSAYGFTGDGFTLGWEDVPYAKSYNVSLIEQTPGTEPYSETQDFNGINASTAEFNANDTPEGWEITLNSDMQVTADGGSGGSAAIVLGSDDDLITLPANGGNYTSLSCTVIPLTPIEDTYCFFMIEGRFGNEWKELSYWDIYYDFEPEGPTEISLTEDDLAGCTQIRIFIGDFYDEKFAVDDIAFTTTPAGEMRYVKTKLPVTESAITFTVLDMTKEHFYEISTVGADGKETKPYRTQAKGVAAPAPAAAEISGNVITAEWESAARADRYTVTFYEVSEAAEAQTDYPMLTETFGNVPEDATMEQPVYLNNDVTSLDEYTDTPGWTGVNTAIGGNMAGCADSYNTVSYLCTPEMNLSGTARIAFDVYLTGSDILMVQRSEAEYQYMFVKGGERTRVEFTFENCAPDDCFIIYTSYGSGFLTGNAAVTQDVTAGYPLCRTVGRGSTAGLSAEFEIADPEPDKKYGYRVVSHKDYPSGSVASPSSPLKVASAATGIVETSLAANRQKCTVYNLNGMKISGNGTDGGKVSAPGVYIVVSPQGTRKMVVR